MIDVCCTACDTTFKGTADSIGRQHANCPVSVRGRFVEAPQKTTADPVDHPSHYTAHPSGVECITITEHMNFNLGNAIKYIWRAGLKDSKNHREDLKKAAWYVTREIHRIDHEAKKAAEKTVTRQVAVNTNFRCVGCNRYTAPDGNGGPCKDCASTSEHP